MHVTSHSIDVISQILSHSSHIRHAGPPTKPTLHTDLPCKPRHLICKHTQRLHHPVHRLLQIEDLSVHIDSDLLLSGCRQ